MAVVADGLRGLRLGAVILSLIMINSVVLEVSLLYGASHGMFGCQVQLCVVHELVQPLNNYLAKLMNVFYCCLW